MEFIQNELKEIKELLKRQAIQQKEFLTIKEAVEFLSLSTSRLHKMTADKEIPHYKPGGKVIYLRRQELEEWILSGRIAPTDDFDSEIDDYLGRDDKGLTS